MVRPFGLPYGRNGVNQVCHSLQSSKIYTHLITAQFQPILVGIPVLFRENMNVAQSESFMNMFQVKEGMPKLMVMWHLPAKSCKLH
jgi:hypothetical protein